LFGTVILGMLWKRATPAGGWTGLLAGTLSSVGMYAWVKVDPAAVRYVALSSQAQDQAQNMFRALWCCLICIVVTVVVSLLTKPKPDSELKDLVYGLTPIPHEEKVSMFRSPVFWGTVVAIVFVILQIIFW
jgi:solute:Na+ symporter, SSS family